MSAPPSPIFTDEEINQHARGNASGMPYLMTAYALECGRTADDAAAFAGRIFAPGWEDTRGQGALVAARYMALNMASGGGVVRSLTGDERHAETRVAGLASDEELAFFGLTREDADRFTGTFVPIATYLGLRAAWRREGDEIVVTVEQPG